MFVKTVLPIPNADATSKARVKEDTHGEEQVGMSLLSLGPGAD
jgi:hypothetical protein